MPRLTIKCTCGARYSIPDEAVECASELEVATPSASDNTTKVEITPTCGDCRHDGEVCKICVDKSHFDAFIEPA